MSNENKKAKPGGEYRLLPPEPDEVAIRAIEAWRRDELTIVRSAEDPFTALNEEDSQK